MVEDVRLTLEGRVPVEFYSRVGGNVPLAEEILECACGANQVAAPFPLCG
jgi:hypothetical protein